MTIHQVIQQVNQLHKGDLGSYFARCPQCGSHVIRLDFVPYADNDGEPVEMKGNHYCVNEHCPLSQTPLEEE